MGTKPTRTYTHIWCMRILKRNTVLFTPQDDRLCILASTSPETPEVKCPLMTDLSDGRPARWPLTLDVSHKTGITDSQSHKALCARYSMLASCNIYSVDFNVCSSGSAKQSAAKVSALALPQVSMSSPLLTMGWQFAWTFWLDNLYFILRNKCLDKSHVNRSSCMKKKSSCMMQNISRHDNKSFSLMLYKYYITISWFNYNNFKLELKSNPQTQKNSGKWLKWVFVCEQNPMQRDQSCRDNHISLFAWTESSETEPA